MREFYYGGRRTTGCALLITACVLMVGWLRSHILTEEIIAESSGDETYLIRSHDGALRFVYRVWSARGGVREVEDLLIPYVAIALPSVLLSAYLILWKPRQTTRPGSSGNGNSS